MSMKQEEKISIPTDYKVVIPDWVLEEETKQLEREQKQQEDTESVNEVFEEFNQQPNYEVENLKIRLDNARNKITELTIKNRNLEERYKQLKARTTVQPSNNVPAPQGSILRTKIVVNPFFRDVIHLKGSKATYANTIINTSQNKYVRLEPL